MVGRGQETPENHPLIVIRGFFYRLVSTNRPKKQITWNVNHPSNLQSLLTRRRNGAIGLTQLQLKALRLG